MKRSIFTMLVFCGLAPAKAYAYPIVNFTTFCFNYQQLCSSNLETGTGTGTGEGGGFICPNPNAPIQFSNIFATPTNDPFIFTIDYNNLFDQMKGILCNCEGYSNSYAIPLPPHGVVYGTYSVTTSTEICPMHPGNMNVTVTP